MHHRHTTLLSRSGRVRASDADRADTVARLHHALGEGRLDLAETDERVAAAYAARYRSELPPLLADLPDAIGPDGLGTRPGAGVERHLVRPGVAGPRHRLPGRLRGTSHEPGSAGSPRAWPWSRWSG